MKIKGMDLIGYSICGILFLCGILIGSPLKNNIVIVNIFVMLLSIIYLIYHYKKEPEKRITYCMVDGFVVLLMVSSCIPLLAKTYVSLEGTIEYILRYSTITCFYFLVRNLITVDKKYVQYLVNTILVTGIVIFFFGIDNLTYNWARVFLEKIGTILFKNRDLRFFSTFAYANTLAVFMGMMTFLSIQKYQKCLKKYQKPIYSVLLYIATFAILASTSRSVWIMFGILLFGYFCFIPKKSRKEYAILLSLIGSITLITGLLFQKLLGSGQYVLIYGMLLVSMIGIYAIFLSIEKLIQKIEKIKWRYWLIMIVVMSSGIILITTKGLKLTKPLELFNSIYAEKSYTQEIYNIEPEKKYRFEIEMEAKVNFNTVDVYEVQIQEINPHGDKIKEYMEKFNEIDETKIIELTTSRYTNKINIVFKTLNTVVQRYLKINKLVVNEKEIVLEYKYLPKNIVQKIQNINISSRSVSERVMFWKDGFQLLKKHWILGIGGDGWKHVQGTVQSYSYGTNEVHSYLLEIGIEFGIIGLIAITGIIIGLLYEIIRNRKTIVKVGIVFALILLLIHSFMDFDMSFMYMMLLAFTLMAVVITKQEKKEQTKKIAGLKSVIIGIGIGLACIPNMQKVLAMTRKELDEKLQLVPYQVSYQEEKIEQLQNQGKVAKKELEDLLEKEPYYNIFEYLSRMEANIIENQNKDDLEEQIEFIYEKQKERKWIAKYDALARIYQYEDGMRFIEELEKIDEKKWANQFRELMKEQLEDNINVIQNQEKNGLSEKEIQGYLEKLKKWRKTIDNN